MRSPAETKKWERKGAEDLEKERRRQYDPRRRGNGKNKANRPRERVSGPRSRAGLTQCEKRRNSSYVGKSGKKKTEEDCEYSPKEERTSKRASTNRAFRCGAAEISLHRERVNRKESRGGSGGNRYSGLPRSEPT